MAESSGWSVALWAEGTPLVAWWNFCEGVGRVELGWRLFWSEVEKLEVFGQILGVGVCGGTRDAHGVSGWMEGWLGKVDAQGVLWRILGGWCGLWGGNFQRKGGLCVCEGCGCLGWFLGMFAGW